MTLSRRFFLRGLIAAPIICRAESLMKIKGLREFGALATIIEPMYWVYDPERKLVVHVSRTKILASKTFMPYFGPPPLELII